MSFLSNCLNFGFPCSWTIHSSARFYQNATSYFCIIWNVWKSANLTISSLAFALLSYAFLIVLVLKLYLSLFKFWNFVCSFSLRTHSFPTSPSGARSTCLRLVRLLFPAPRSTFFPVRCVFAQSPLVKILSFFIVSKYNLLINHQSNVHCTLAWHFTHFKRLLIQIFTFQDWSKKRSSSAGQKRSRDEDSDEPLLALLLSDSPQDQSMDDIGTAVFATPRLA